MYSYEIVGWCWRGGIYCTGCHSRGEPIFAGDENADNERCSDCGCCLSGEDKTRDEQEAEDAEQDRVEEEARAAAETATQRKLEELDEDMAESEKELAEFQREVEAKRIKAAAVREALLAEKDE